eukprot:4567188-Amphidinium_carterae.2
MKRQSELEAADAEPSMLVFIEVMPSYAKHVAILLAFGLIYLGSDISLLTPHAYCTNGLEMSSQGYLLNETYSVASHRSDGRYTACNALGQDQVTP